MARFKVISPKRGGLVKIGQFAEGEVEIECANGETVTLKFDPGSQENGTISWDYSAGDQTILFMDLYNDETWETIYYFYDFPGIGITQLDGDIYGMRMYALDDRIAYDSGFTEEAAQEYGTFLFEVKNGGVIGESWGDMYQVSPDVYESTRFKIDKTFKAMGV